GTPTTRGGAGKITGGGPTLTFTLTCASPATGIETAVASSKTKPMCLIMVPAPPFWPVRVVQRECHDRNIVLTRSCAALVARSVDNMGRLSVSIRCDQIAAP